MSLVIQIQSLYIKKMIEVAHLSKNYGSLRAVDDLTFNVKQGEVLGFLGPNGAGKSTTMKMITGFVPPSSGKIHIDGIDIEQEPVQVKKMVGYLPEGAPNYGEMTPLQFLDFIADIRQLDNSYKKERIECVVERLRLDSVLYQQIDTLSKGFKRRVGLAQAIIHDPEILIMDEPTDGLDPNQKHEVRLLLNEISAGKIIIISTHILEEVEAVCSRAIIIANGKLLLDETPAEMQARSENKKLDAVFREVTKGHERE